MREQLLRLPKSRPDKRIEIDDAPDDPEATSTRLLGAMVRHAMIDDMTGIALGCDVTKGEAYYRGFGPKSRVERQWWDLTPPPVELYPHLLQRVVALTKFQRGLPLTGILTTKLGRSRVRLRVELPELTRIELHWD